MSDRLEAAATLLKDWQNVTRILRENGHTAEQANQVAGILLADRLEKEARS